MISLWSAILTHDVVCAYVLYVHTYVCENIPVDGIQVGKYICKCKLKHSLKHAAYTVSKKVPQFINFPLYLSEGSYLSVHIIFFFSFSIKR